MALWRTGAFLPSVAPSKGKSLDDSCFIASPPSFASAFPVAHGFKKNRRRKSELFSMKMGSSLTSRNFPNSNDLVGSLRLGKKLHASKVNEEFEPDMGKKGGESSSRESDEDDDFMDADERKEWRRKIREVMDTNPIVEEEVDPVEKGKKLQKLLSDYPLVVDEDDPDWPEDADGWGFNLDQFFNKITIKNVKKKDADDESYDSENEVVWQDDNYIRPIKDITSSEWEETVFKDISPLILLVHNRYKRPKENEQMRDELEKAVNIIWNCRLPSPRCVAIDAVIEVDLVSALQVPVFPELIFTKAGKILYREKAIRSANELSKVMAFFYYGAAKPPILNNVEKLEENIPTLPINIE